MSANTKQMLLEAKELGGYQLIITEDDNIQPGALGKLAAFLEGIRKKDIPLNAIQSAINARY